MSFSRASLYFHLGIHLSVADRSQETQVCSFMCNLIFRCNATQLTSLNIYWQCHIQFIFHGSTLRNMKKDSGKQMNRAELQLYVLIIHHTLNFTLKH